MSQFNGTSGADTLPGTPGNDTISGLEGPDTLEGLDGDDQLFGGAGNDMLRGGAGNDYLDGQEGFDLIEGGAGNDTLVAGGGDDTLDGQDGDDRLFASSVRTSGTALMRGGAGNDTITGSAGADTISGGAGNDYLEGQDGADALNGGEGNDTLVAGGGRDLLEGGEGDDRLFVSNRYEAAGQFMRGGGGADTISGGAADDLIDGGAGGDDLFGEGGHDNLMGGDGHDRLYGQAGNDTLAGGDGNDTLSGGDGDDTYILSDARDRIIDSGGNDKALITGDWIKVPAEIEVREYAQGVRVLPYWIDALVHSNANWVSTLIPANRSMAYAFPSSMPAYLKADAKEANGYTAFTPSQRASAEEALRYIGSIINLSFTLSNTVDAPNTMAFALNQQTFSAGYAQYPNDIPIGSDVWLNNQTYNATLANGTRGALVLMHEIGHALGLKHPFSRPDAGGDVGEGPYLGSTEERSSWTLMSYAESPDQFKLEFSPLDIAALHYLYGPSPKARAGADTYRLSAAGPNFIWDGAGLDTVDAEGLTSGITLYLEPGRWGHIGTMRQELITAPGQITVNFGTVIERAIGSDYSDRIEGNHADNLIRSGMGDDTLAGGAGNDTLEGGAGFDTFVHSAAAVNIRLSYNRQSGELRLSDQRTDREGIDTLTGVERLMLSDRTLSLQPDSNQAAVLGLARLGLGRDLSAPELAAGVAQLQQSGAAQYALSLIEKLPLKGSDELSALTLERLGLSAQTIRGPDPKASLQALSEALTLIYTVYPQPAARAQVMVNLTSLLSGLASDETYGQAATLFTQQVQGNFVDVAVQVQLVGGPPAG